MFDIFTINKISNIIKVMNFNQLKFEIKNILTFIIIDDTMLS